MRAALTADGPGTIVQPDAKSLRELPLGGFAPAKSELPVDDTLAGASLGGCKVERLLGTGAMGRVYKAHHEGLDRDMAIKVIDEKLYAKPGFAERFVSEARTLAKLDHPNVVRVFNVDKTDSGLQFIVMELLEGGTVDGLLKRSAGKLSIDEAVRVVCDAAKGLFHAHRVGLIHRDVKPANLLLTREGSVKVADFGLAVPTQNEAFVATEIAGTPFYMAPEQADGRPLDARCDQYALGVTLYQLLCGKPPFVKPKAIDILLAHANEEPRKPRELRPDIPEWLEKGILKMLSKPPEGRFASLGDVVKLLEAKSAAAVPDIEPVAAASRLTVKVEDIVNLEKGVAPVAVAPPPAKPVFIAVAACVTAIVLFLAGPGREAIASGGITRREVLPVVAQALKRSTDLAASGRPEDVSAALAVVEDEIADLGPGVGVGALEEQRKALKTQLAEARRGAEKELRDRVAALESQGKFATAIEACKPTDKTLSARGLDEVAATLRDEIAAKLASARNEVYVPSGLFPEGPKAHPTAVAAFYIDRTEVTNEDYARAVSKNDVPAPPSWKDGHPPAGSEKLPVTGVTFEEASRFARSQGKRLPTAVEWEKAARGAQDARLYPWGDRLEAGKANLGGSKLEDVSARSGDVSPYGVLGLAGNALEWVEGPFAAGGCFRSRARSVRVFSRASVDPTTRDPALGFRCARDIEH
jgi:formylglycine-generating enzyme required for sulfatase activity/tRNA A-37 threonylcarbamoyl transferase component Bud32